MVSHFCIYLFCKDQTLTCFHQCATAALIVLSCWWHGRQCWQGISLYRLDCPATGATLRGASAPPEVWHGDTQTDTWDGLKRTAVWNIDVELVERPLPGTLLLNPLIMSLTCVCRMDGNQIYKHHQDGRRHVHWNAALAMVTHQLSACNTLYRKYLSMILLIRGVK